MMKKYTKPEIEIVSFDIESAVMAAAVSEDSPEASPMLGSVTLSSAYIPTDIENRVWTNVDDENWTWE
ncbi:MAG: hypothetical protein IJ300_06445 [Clostridia bacterium]|nr:hypothetical protein [Clostridia bacterium]